MNKICYRTVLREGLVLQGEGGGVVEEPSPTVYCQPLRDLGFQEDRGPFVLLLICGHL